MSDRAPVGGGAHGAGELLTLRASVGEVVRGKADVVDGVLVALLAGGHVLLEDVPGTGKTTLAHAVASAVGCGFARVQFTADLLPSDVLGVSIYDPDEGAFRFHEGPIFRHVVLADEINRTPPKTQSALLEAMNEGQVSVDGVVRPLPSPFLVIATQNPLDHHGTFPLPESQMDRFLVRLSMGYPDERTELELLLRAGEPPRTARPVLDPARVLALRDAAMRTTLHEDVAAYALALARATRAHEAVQLGVSTRGALALGRAARARAFLMGRDHAVPDDVIALLQPVLAHRLVLAPRASRGATPSDVLDAVLAAVPPPR